MIDDELFDCGLFGSFKFDPHSLDLLDSLESNPLDSLDLLDLLESNPLDHDSFNFDSSSEPDASEPDPLEYAMMHTEMIDRLIAAIDDVRLLNPSILTAPSTSTAPSTPSAPFRSTTFDAEIDEFCKFDIHQVRRYFRQKKITSDERNAMLTARRRYKNRLYYRKNKRR